MVPADRLRHHDRAMRADVVHAGDPITAGRALIQGHGRGCRRARERQREDFGERQRVEGRLLGIMGMLLGMLRSATGASVKIQTVATTQGTGRASRP